MIGAKRPPGVPAEYESGQDRLSDVVAAADPLRGEPCERPHKKSDRRRAQGDRDIFPFCGRSQKGKEEPVVEDPEDPDRQPE
jgi:hypothetical protein